MLTTPKKYLQIIFPFFNTTRTKEIFRVNPTVIPVREEAKETTIYVYDYNATALNEKDLKNVEDCFAYKDNNNISWINIDGIRKTEVETLCQHYGIHYLLMEDILSIGQRPKMDEVDDVLFCLLNMLYFNDKEGSVETEQISIVLGKKFVLSFQEFKDKDVFNPLREKLRISNTRLRQSNADYLCYSMIDLIVDNYYNVLEKLGEKIEELEEEIIRYGNTRSLARISSFR